jgi:hypothetical protein
MMWPKDWIQIPEDWSPRRSAGSSVINVNAQVVVRRRDDAPDMNIACLAVIPLEDGSWAWSSQDRLHIVTTPPRASDSVDPYADWQWSTNAGLHYARAARAT